MSAIGWIALVLLVIVFISIAVYFSGPESMDYPSEYNREIEKRNKNWKQSILHHHIDTYEPEDDFHYEPLEDNQNQK